ncbi:cache domain-containing sensor histidine kinase [Paenibacillus sp. 1001270B_150601_E10]|uniref:cache domain-containing sensor histidine kinase n=1 Tax=Paenibacillus sp. 1001270B_150601_E10 TaxID=2787079 RepID=UPI00189CF796|nr:sensor histidine kinase [Paenibacillus sp. 1001270B_150601_E10]
MIRSAIQTVIGRVRLKHKLFLSYLLVIVIPIGVLGWYNFRQSEQLLDVQANQAIERNADTLAESLRYTLQQYQHTANSILYSSPIRKILTTDYHDLVNLRWDLDQYVNPSLTFIRALNKSILNIRIYEQGRLPEYGGDLLHASRVEQEPWYVKMQTEQESIWGKNGGRIYIAAPFPGIEHADRQAALYIEMQEQLFFQGIDQLASDMGVILTDANGHILYSNHKLDDLLLQQPSISEAQLVQQGPGVIEVGGRELLVKHIAIPEADWTLHSYVLKSQVKPSSSGILRASILVISLCAIAVLIISLLLSSRMIRRIDRLVGWMKRVKRGDLDVRIANTSKDEIGQLTEHFSDMVHQVNRLIQEVYANQLVKKEAELRALQSQINPHFLYNTLSLINFKAIEHDEHEISHVVTSLSKFYRTALNKGNQRISVRDELHNIRSYLEIVQIMKDHFFDVQYEVEEDVLDYQTINLILQPIVENAIEHGLKKIARRGQLIIRAAMVEKELVFMIEDNGAGISGERLTGLLSTESDSYGLKNVNERIQLTFGVEYGIQLQSNVGNGTRVSINLPVVTFEAKAAP